MRSYFSIYPQSLRGSGESKSKSEAGLHRAEQKNGINLVVCCANLMQTTYSNTEAYSANKDRDRLNGGLSANLCMIDLHPVDLVTNLRVQRFSMLNVDNY